MKCDTCKFKEHHFPGDAEDIINYGDDPYDYDYCDLLYWCGDPLCDPRFDPEKCENYVLNK